MIAERFEVKTKARMDMRHFKPHFKNSFKMCVIKDGEKKKIHTVHPPLQSLRLTSFAWLEVCSSGSTFRLTFFFYQFQLPIKIVKLRNIKKNPRGTDIY